MTRLTLQHDREMFHVLPQRRDSRCLYARDVVRPHHILGIHRQQYKSSRRVEDDDGGALAFSRTPSCRV